MNIAIIDVGSNTIRLNVYTVQKDKTYDLLLSRKIAAGLANSVVDGQLSEDGIVRLCHVLEDFKKVLKNLKVDHLEIFATAALRNISNTHTVLQRVQWCTGYTLSVLSGESEARIGYEGVRSRIGAREGILADIGGGSTELTSFTPVGPIVCASYPLGSLTLFGSCVPTGILPTADEIAAIRKQIDAVLTDAEIARFGHSSRLYAIGGSTRAVVKLANDLLGRRQSQTTISREELQKLCDILFAGDMTARNAIIRCCPNRLHTVIPGLAVLLRLVERLGADAVEMCPYGVREGYLERVLARL